MDDWNLAGRVAVVTGGAGGLGSAIVASLRQQGAFVVSFDLAPPRDDDQVMLDLTDDVAVRHSVDAVLAVRKRIDILVNCAGFAKHEPLEAVTADSWREVLDANLTTAFLTSRAIAPHMRRQGWGRIVNIGSEQALQGDPGLAHYAAAKAGLISLTRTFAIAYAPEVTVNLVSPGPTETEKFRRGPHYDAAQMLLLPLKRFGRPADIARSVTFLVGPGGDFYTGQQLDPNGGADLPAGTGPVTSKDAQVDRPRSQHTQ